MNIDVGSREQRGEPLIDQAPARAGMGQGLLVIKHRAEIARVEATFKKVTLNRRRPMSTTREIA
jgi:hypothetical protein